MVRFPPLLCLLGLGLLVGGCSANWVGEDRAYAMKTEFRQAVTFSWVRDAKNAIGFDKVFKTSKQQEDANEQVICMHPNGENRVITQNGVTDEVEYRRCAMAPYPMDGGSRLGNRPDGVGTVAD